MPLSSFLHSSARGMNLALQFTTKSCILLRRTRDALCIHPQTHAQGETDDALKLFSKQHIMNIQIDKTNDCQATLKAVVATEDVAKLKADIAKSYSKNANVPGFRPGKAPLQVITKRYASAIEEEVEGRLLEQVQEQTLSENENLMILDFVDVTSAFTDEGSFTVDATLTVIPEFELPEYKGLPVSVPTTEVSDSEVEDTLKQYAESSAKHEPVERAAEMGKGDICVIDFTTSIDGQSLAEFCGKPVGFMEGREGHWVEMAEDRFMPGLAEGLEGALAGDEREIMIELKEDFPLSDIAGKEVLFACKITEVREKQTPEINEELFAAALPDKTLDEIKEIVRENMTRSKEQSNDEAKIDQVTEIIADKLTFSLPEALVERELDNTVQRKMYEAMQGGDYSIMQKMDELRESSREETMRNLRVYFALQLIAKNESIVAADQEVYYQIAQLAEKEGEKNLKTYMRKMVKENRITGIRQSIITSKVLELITRNAEVTTTTEEAAAESSEEAPAADTPAEESKEA